MVLRIRHHTRNSPSNNGNGAANARNQRRNPNSRLDGGPHGRATRGRIQQSAIWRSHHGGRGWIGKYGDDSTGRGKLKQIDNTLPKLQILLCLIFSMSSLRL